MKTTFKIGDTVVLGDGTLTQITIIEPKYYCFSNGFQYGIKTPAITKMKHWEPTEGEWCWYGFELVQVIDVTNDHIKICRQKSDAYEELDVKALEPFTGQLPSFIKD